MAKQNNLDDSFGREDLSYAGSTIRMQGASAFAPETEVQLLRKLLERKGVGVAEIDNELNISFNAVPEPQGPVEEPALQDRELRVLDLSRGSTPPNAPISPQAPAENTFTTPALENVLHQVGRLLALAADTSENATRQAAKQHETQRQWGNLSSASLSSQQGPELQTQRVRNVKQQNQAPAWVETIGLKAGKVDLET